MRGTGYDKNRRRTPGVASSDATNISSTIERDGDEYVVNGHKWYISGAVRNSCKIAIFLGKTPNEAFKRHQQQSMILVPVHLEGEAMYPGVEILRSMAVFGHEGDHAEMIFDNVRVPAGNMILGEGRGFEIAQGRLGPVPPAAPPLTTPAQAATCMRSPAHAPPDGASGAPHELSAAHFLRGPSRGASPRAAVGPGG